MIPVNEPVLGDRELEYVTQCIRTAWISSAGEYIERFESGWANYCGAEHGIAVSNGTTALQLAVRCLELGPGDEVIMPTFTIISCALAVLDAGCRPVLVDSDPRTFCMDVAEVEAKITSRTRAIMAVHIYGHPVDMDPLKRLAERHGLAIIEDAAEAHGAEYETRTGTRQSQWLKCGGIGTIATFSFYANKLITTGEGGMIVTSDKRLAQRARELRNLCFRPERRFFHTELGYNYRLTNMQAALGVAQLERFSGILERKRMVGRRYAEEWGSVPSVAVQMEEPWARSVFWMNGVVIDRAMAGFDAAEAAQRLSRYGVETRPFFLGMHEQPVFHDRGLFVGHSYPVAENLARQGLYLPSGLALTDEQLHTSAAALREILS